MSSESSSNGQACTDGSSDEELEPWFTHTDEERYAAFDDYEHRCLSLQEEFNAVPHIGGPLLVSLSDRFEVLASAVVSSL